MGLRPTWLGVFAPLLALVPLTTVYFILFIRPELIVLSEEDRVQLAVERRKTVVRRATKVLSAGVAIAAFLVYSRFCSQVGR